MIWPCKITGLTHGPDGRKHTVSAAIEGAGNASGNAVAYMLSRKDAWLWLGCQIRVTTPLLQVALPTVEYENAA